MYTTRYGTQENIYEDIEAEHRFGVLNGGESMISLPQSVVEEEFRRVENRHRRVLAELNLSTEAMLMPSTPPSYSGPEEQYANSEHLSELMKSVEITDELASPVSGSVVGNGDIDSGFSGSSIYSENYRSGGKANFVTYSSRSKLTFPCDSYEHAVPTESPKNKSSFWSRKRWRKLPGILGSGTQKTSIENDYIGQNETNKKFAMSVSYDNEYAITLIEISAVCTLPTKVPAGTLIRILEADKYGALTFTRISCENRFFEIARKQKCSNIEGILFIAPDVFKFAISIHEPIDRINFCRSEGKQKFISQLEVNDPVKIPRGSVYVVGGTLCRATVKYIGCYKELGPGIHFIVSLLERDCTFVPLLDREIAIPNSLEINWNRCVLLSAEHIFNNDLEYWPDVGLFHLYQRRYLESSMIVRRHSDVHEKPPKPNPSNVFETNTSKTSEKPLSTNWPSCAKPQSELLSGKLEEQTSSTSGSSYAKPKLTPITKSSNPLDHINQNFRNANENIPPQTGTSHYWLRKRESISVNSYTKSADD